MFGLTIIKKKELEDLKSNLRYKASVINEQREHIQEMRIKLDKYQPIQGNGGRFVKKIITTQK
jgi:hypothetical protein